MRARWGRREIAKWQASERLNKPPIASGFLLVAGKAGLNPKHLKKIKAICAKYRDALDERSRRGRPDSGSSAALP